MNSIFKSENYRFLKSKEMKAMAVIALLFNIAGSVIMWFVMHNNFFSELLGEDLSFFKAASFLDTFPDSATDFIFGIMLLIMTSSLIIRLYQSGVVKQLVSSGISRSQVISGQFLSLTLFFSVIALMVSLVQGIGNLILGGGFGLTEGTLLRLLLATAGMILTVANFVALYMLIAHLTSSMAGSIVINMLIEMASSTGVMYLARVFKCQAINRYYFINLREDVISMTGELSSQLKSMGILLIYTLVFFFLCQLVFSRKEIK